MPIPGRPLSAGLGPQARVQAAASAAPPTPADQAPTASNPAISTLCSPLAPLASVSAAAGGAASGTVLGLSASWLFGATSAFMVPVYGLMAFLTDSKLTRSTLLNSTALYVGLALLYAATLVAAWQQAGLGAALGAVAAAVRAAAESGSLGALDLRPVAALFSEPLVTLLAWLHLLTLDALMAREIALDGIRTGVATAHSILLCFFFGPTGLLSHALTRMLRGRARS